MQPPTHQNISWPNLCCIISVALLVHICGDFRTFSQPFTTFTCVSCALMLKLKLIYIQKFRKKYRKQNFRNSFSYSCSNERRKMTGVPTVMTQERHLQMSDCNISNGFSLVICWSLSRSTCPNPPTGRETELHLPWCPMKPDCETSRRSSWSVPVSPCIAHMSLMLSPHPPSSGIRLPCMLTSQRRSSRRGRTRFKRSIRKPSLVKSPSCFAPRTASWVAWQTETSASLTSVRLILGVISSSMVLRRYALVLVEGGMNLTLFLQPFLLTTLSSSLMLLLFIAHGTNLTFKLFLLDVQSEGTIGRFVVCLIKLIHLLVFRCSLLRKRWLPTPCTSLPKRTPNMPTPASVVHV